MIKCRTMASQRPCNNAMCEREDCIRMDAAEEFTAGDLRMIKAMCETANPQFPDCEMYPAWQHVYAVAVNKLKSMEVATPQYVCECGAVMP